MPVAALLKEAVSFTTQALRRLFPGKAPWMAAPQLRKCAVWGKVCKVKGWHIHYGPVSGRSWETDETRAWDRGLKRSARHRG